jgi:hypothetical protein
MSLPPVVMAVIISHCPVYRVCPAATHCQDSCMIAQTDRLRLVSRLRAISRIAVLALMPLVFYYTSRGTWDPRHQDVSGAWSASARAGHHRRDSGTHGRTAIAPRAGDWRRVPASARDAASLVSAPAASPSSPSSTISASRAAPSWFSDLRCPSQSCGFPSS